MVLYSSYGNKRRRRDSYTPFSGNGLKRATSGGRFVRRSTRVNSKSLVSAVRAMNDYKHSTISDLTFGTSTYHNNIYCLPLSQQISQGVDNTTRIGDEIYLTSLKIRAILSSPSASGAYTYRILVGFSGVNYNTNNSTTGLGVGDLFLPSSAGPYFNTNAIVNPKAFTCLYDETWNLPSVVPLTSDSVAVVTTIPIKQKFVYKSTALGGGGGVYGKNKNLYAVVIPTALGGTTGTTVSGAYSVCTDLIFQDM